MAGMETSQQIDLQQGTVYSLQMKWSDAYTQNKVCWKSDLWYNPVHQPYRHLSAF